MTSVYRILCTQALVFRVSVKVIIRRFQRWDLGSSPGRGTNFFLFELMSSVYRALYFYIFYAFVFSQLPVGTGRFIWHRKKLYFSQHGIGFWGGTRIVSWGTRGSFISSSIWDPMILVYLAIYHSSHKAFGQGALAV